MVVANDSRAKVVEGLLLKYGLSNRWLAKKLGASHGSVNNWLDPEGGWPRNRGIYDEMLDLIKEHAPKEASLVRRGGVRLIPVYAAIPAGTPGSNSMDVDYEEMVDWGNDFERWGRIVEGYSMADILLPGDIAIFENRRYEQGDVVHAYSHGEDCVKVIRNTGEDTQLWSFNQDYEPFSASGWKAKGVCVGRIRYGPYRIRQLTEFPHGLKWAMRLEKL